MLQLSHRKVLSVIQKGERMEERRRDSKGRLLHTGETQQAKGSMRIDTVRISDAKCWLIKLQKIDGKN